MVNLASTVETALPRAKPPLIKANVFWLITQWVLAIGAVLLIMDHGSQVDPIVWWVFAGRYLATGFGVTVGYHRFATHGGFKTYPWVKAILLFLGGCTVEGPLPRWKATHEAHHAFNDQKDLDPHTPLQAARMEPLEKLPTMWWQVWTRLCRYEFVITTALGQHYMTIPEWIRGAWYSHYGWFLRDKPLAKPFNNYGPADRIEAIQSKYYAINVTLGFLIPWAITGFTFDGLVIGCGLCAFVLFNATAAINSVCHLLGTQLADPKAQARAKHSRNVWWLFLFSLGEAWHNAHHALASCVAHGWRLWQIDPSKYFIWTMERFGLAWNVKWQRAERKKILAYRPKPPPEPAPA